MRKSTRSEYNGTHIRDGFGKLLGFVAEGTFIDLCGLTDADKSYLDSIGIIESVGGNSDATTRPESNDQGEAVGDGQRDDPDGASAV